MDLSGPLSMLRTAGLGGEQRGRPSLAGACHVQRARRVRMLGLGLHLGSLMLGSARRWQMLGLSWGLQLLDLIRGWQKLY